MPQGPTRPWTQKMAELLSDGAWHQREVIEAAMAAQVPDDRALQHITVQRNSMRRGGGSASATSIRRDADGSTVEMGRRRIAVQAVSNRILEGRIEEQDGLIRLSPPAHKRLAPYTRKMLEYLSDGRVHDFEEVLTHCARFVPPEKGYRNEFRTRLSQPQYSNEDQMLAASGKRGADMHSAGQRRIMRRAIQRQVQYGRLIMEDGKIWRADG